MSIKSIRTQQTMYASFIFDNYVLFYFIYVFIYLFFLYFLLRMLYLALYAENALVVYKRNQDNSIEEIRVCNSYYPVLQSSL